MSHGNEFLDNVSAHLSLGKYGGNMTSSFGPFSVLFAIISDTDFITRLLSDGKGFSLWFHGKLLIII